VFIVRHADKFSSYPPCAPPTSAAPCYNASLMGNNPPLTPCGFEQAEATARWLLSTASIQQIVMSPYIRTLETALPVANVTGLTLHVEYLTSEARQSGGPSRPFNVALDETHRSRLARAQARWALDYGSFPIPTPEGNGEYWGRVRLAAKALRHRFPPSTGNVAIFTHATTSFSLAYGLCYGDNGTDATLQAFVERQVRPPVPQRLAAISHQAPSRHSVHTRAWPCPGRSSRRRASRRAPSAQVVSSTSSLPATGSAARSPRPMACGATEPYKCIFADYPAWYWEHSAGIGPGKCS